MAGMTLREELSSPSIPLVLPSRPVALLLGSGFKGLAGLVKPVRRISYAEMDGYAPHAGIQPERVPQATLGTIDGVSTMVYPTRLHLYHGHSAHEVTSLVRHARASGCETAVFLGACGVVDGDLSESLGVVTDHINLTGENPLVGWRASGQDSFVPMEEAYDRELRDLAIEVAQARSIDLREGVYAEMRGPSLETPAEVRALRMLGASFVGMSLTLEVIMARALGMRVLAIVLPTNPAGAAWVSHRSVRAEVTSFSREVELIVRGVLARL